jgi:hypothetical protein
MTNNLELKDFLPFATSLFGAFFGALGAYLVGRFKEKRDVENRRHTALLATQYALYSQWSIIEDIRKNFLEPLRNDPQRHLKQLEYMRVVGELHVPFDELTFIIDSKEPNLLQEIHIAEKRFTSSTDLLKKLNQKRIEIQDKYPPKKFDTTIGKGEIDVPVYEIFRLKASSNLLYDEVDKAGPDLWNTIKLVFDFVKVNFKGKKAAKFVALEKQINPSSSPR